MNADGFGDVLIGAEFENSNTGAVYVAYGGQPGQHHHQQFTPVGARPGRSLQ
ncbi:MAG: FG-GAP repeat protein [Chloroflexi bacterium]|nr:FG-GAP repeat protein [Chloroflexota bacterium]